MNDALRAALRDAARTRQESDPAGFACQVAAGIGLLFILALITGRIAGADGGSYADWVAAFATLAAFGAAVVAAWFGARAFAKEAQRDSDRLQEARRAQAALVAAWPGPADVTPVFADAGPLHPREIERVAATVRNASQVPITDVQLQIEFTNYADDTVTFSTPLFLIKIPVVPPDTQAQRILKDLPEPIPLTSLAINGVDLDSQEALQIRLRVALTFTDAANVRWHRNGRGLLGEVIANPTPQ